MTPADKVRVTLSLTPKELAEIRARAKKEGRTVNAQMRIEFATYGHLAEAEDDGDRILLEGSHGKRQLILP